MVRAYERDFLLGTVSIWVPKKAPTKFHPNPHLPSVFLGLALFSTVALLYRGQASAFTTSFLYQGF